jgi:hypothetical protein
VRSGARPEQENPITFEVDALSSKRCYESVAACGSVASNSCGRGGAQCVFDPGNVCATTGPTYNYFCAAA